MTSPSGDPRVVPALVAAAVAISFASIFFRLAAPTPPLVAAGLRLAIASALLWPVLLRRSAAARLTPALVRTAVVAGLFYGLHFGSWVTSLGLTSVAASVTLVTATPLLLGTVALVTGRDRPSRRHWLAIGLAVAGVSIIAAGDASGPSGALAGDLLAFLGAVAMAGYMLASRSLGAALDVGAFTAVATLTGAAVLLGSAALLGVALLPPSAEAAGWIALAALVPQLVGHTLLTWALRHTRPTVVGMSTVAEPVGATFLSWLWLDESVPPVTLAGSAVTISAVALALRESERVPSGVQGPARQAST